jgi:hypothetical protein
MKSSVLVCEPNKKAVTLLMIVGVMLLFVNVLLVRQNKKLKVLAGRPDRALEISPGTAVPPLEGIDSNGGLQSINYGQDRRKTVLLVLSSRCYACEENMPNMRAIINRLDRQSFRLAAVSLQSDGFKEYSNRFGINQIPILTKIDPKYRVAYKLALTPQIILIAPDGKVEKVWTGLLQREDIQDVERALNVRLP